MVLCLHITPWPLCWVSFCGLYDGVTCYLWTLCWVACHSMVTMLGYMSFHGLYARFTCYSMVSMIGYMLLESLYARLHVTLWPLCWGYMFFHGLYAGVACYSMVSLWSSVKMPTDDAPQWLIVWFILKHNEMLKVQSDNTLRMKLRLSQKSIRNGINFEAYLIFDSYFTHIFIFHET